MPIEQALAAASWRAREFLGLPAIQEGAPADLVAFDRNPLEDPTVLSGPRLIVLDGMVIQGPPAHHAATAPEIRERTRGLGGDGAVVSPGELDPG